MASRWDTIDTGDGQMRCYVSVPGEPGPHPAVIVIQHAGGVDEFIRVMESAQMLDLTVPFSCQTPQWLNYVPLSVTYTKRVGGQYFGMGRNGSICNASIHLATHMDGEKHFYPAGRAIGQVPLDEWVGPGVIADISQLVSDASVYTWTSVRATSSSSRPVGPNMAGTARSPTNSATW